MAAISLNLLTQVVCNQSALRTLQPTTAPAPVCDALHRNAVLALEQLPSWTPRHKRTQDWGQRSHCPAVGRVSGRALRAEQMLFSPPVEISPELEEVTIIQELVPRIKENLSCIRNSQGEINVSAYDTAWVARIPKADGSGGPHFPETLEWLVANQHSDGSWGDDQKDWLYDQYIQTLACIVALKTWDIYPAAVQRGVEYFMKNVERLDNEELVTLPIGFEVSFPGLLEEAKTLGVDLPYDAPFFQVMEETRQEKLRRIPLELMYQQPTTLLYSLEGLQTLDIEWDKVLKFQGVDGSVGCSPASTVAVYLNTGDKMCLSFLEAAVKTFNNAVPCCYPLDVFQNLWIVDTLQRLGISRYFEDEIEYILSTAYRQWSDEEGITWATVLKGLPDLDDTSMAFRLFRQHGFKVSEDGFKGFQKDKAFVCFPVGQMWQGVSDMFNLIRACQTAYPGENRLVEGEEFSRGFLSDKLKNNMGHADKWSLKSDMSGEVEYELKHPEHKSLNRMKVLNYLDKYGPEDAWIGKTIYRLRLVNNYDYLELAKADFSMCLQLHQKELRQILGWISDSGLTDSSKVRERVALLFAMFSAEVWEPEFSAVRLAAGKCLFIALAMYKLFAQQTSLTDLRQLVDAVKRWDPTGVQDLPEKFSTCFMVLYNTVNESAHSSTNQKDVTKELVHIWERLLAAFLSEAEWRAENSVGATEKARKAVMTPSGLETLVLSSILISGEIKNPQFVASMEKNSTLLRAVSEAVGIAQGFAVAKDAATAVQKEETQFVKMQQQARELNWQMGQTSVPAIVKRVLLSFTKVANCYYDRDDEKFEYLSMSSP